MRRALGGGGPRGGGADARIMVAGAGAAGMAAAHAVGARVRVPSGKPAPSHRASPLGATATAGATDDDGPRATGDAARCGESGARASGPGGWGARAGAMPLAGTGDARPLPAAGGGGLGGGGGVGTLAMRGPVLAGGGGGGGESASRGLSRPASARRRWECLYSHHDVCTLCVHEYDRVCAHLPSRLLRGISCARSTQRAACNTWDQLGK
jgi:hypothetical protein